MKIEVAFPISGNRLAPDYADKISEGHFSAMLIKTVVCKIQVSELNGDENPRGILNFEYEEDFVEDNTFGEVISRAEFYARDYCARLGIGAD